VSIAGEANIDRLSVLSQVRWAISFMVANPLSWVRSIDSHLKNPSLSYTLFVYIKTPYVVYLSFKGMKKRKKKLYKKVTTCGEKIKYDRVKSESYKLGLALIIESASTSTSRALWNSVNGNS